MTQEQTHSEAPETDTPEDGSLDAAALAFETRENSPVEGEDAAEAEDQAGADPNEEAPEADPDEDTGPELVELDYEGIKIRVEADKAEEARKALLRQSDYSRKMNELSTKEKQVTSTFEQAELVRQGAEKFAKALAQIEVLDGQLKQYEALDWQTLRQNDPAQYAAYAADYQTAKLNRQQAEMQARGIRAEVEEASSRAIQTKRAEMFAEVKKHIPEWSNELGEKLTGYALSRGVSFDTLAKTTDAGVILALHDAMKYAALKKGAAEVKAKAKTAPPVLKPGAAKQQANPQADALARLRKSNTVDDAAAAFLSRMK